jgi:glutathione S-transferase
MTNELTVISHRLCPYVQRAIIILEEKCANYCRKDVDLANKPEWFLKVSPLGKTPVLLVSGDAIFESAVICEYLDETLDPRMHPTDPLEKARHRAWMEFGSSVLNTIAGFYSAQSEEQLMTRATELRGRFAQLDAALGSGPYFSGNRFCLVDAAFAPVFRYFDVFDPIYDMDFFSHTPKVAAWRRVLAKRRSVQRAIDPEYPRLLSEFIANRHSALSQRLQRIAA